MSRVIDDGGRFFDIKITDLNNDRREDLLVTINAASNGSVMAYEIPDDFRYRSIHNVPALAKGKKPKHCEWATNFACYEFSR